MPKTNKASNERGFDILGVPHLDQYPGAWMLYEPHMKLLRSVTGWPELSVHCDETLVASVMHGSGEHDGDPGYVVEDGVAVITLQDVMTKYGSSLSAFQGTVVMRRQIRQAVADRQVRSIMLHIDSPGGSAKGVDDLATEVANAEKVKPVVAFVDDLCASGAYYVASQATQILCNPSGIVGSIGVYSVLEDLTVMADQLGIKVYVVRSAEFKALGQPGEPIDAKVLAEDKRIVVGIHDLFVDAISKGRGIDRDAASELADGRVHIGVDAKEIGLVDSIVDGYDAALEATTEITRGDTIMTKAVNPQTADPVKTPVVATPVVATPVASGTTQASGSAPATIAELTALAGDDNSNFILGCLTDSLTLADATTKLVTVQRTEIKATREKLTVTESELNALAEAGQTNAKLGSPGTTVEVTERGGVPKNAETGGVDAFKAAVSQRMTDDNCPKHIATQRVIREQPLLHEAYVEAVNAA